MKKIFVNWATRYNVNPNDAEYLVKLADQYKNYKEKSLNGDPHLFSKNNQDKNENAKMWDHDASQVLAKMKKLCVQMGFREITFTGLYPTFTKGNEKWINLPEQNES